VHWRRGWRPARENPMMMLPCVALVVATVSIALPAADRALFQ
jgi:hypothetical protein